MYFDFGTWGRIARLIRSEPFRPKRALFLLSVYVGLNLLSIINMLSLALDQVFFPGYLEPFGLRFVRTQTLGRKGDHCDFRFERAV